MIPQLIIFAIGMMALGINMAKHGEEKKNIKYNGWLHLIHILILWTTLYYGGFWDAIL